MNTRVGENSMEVPPSGYGPWRVMLLVNVHPSPSKKTDIRVHTYCPLLIKAMNEEPGCLWIPIMIYGPFEQWSAALVFKHKWESTTRNLRNRVDKGWSLFQQYYQCYNLVGLLQTKFMKDYMKHYNWHNHYTVEETKGKRKTKRKKQQKKNHRRYVTEITQAHVTGHEQAQRVILNDIRSLVKRRKQIATYDAAS